MQFCNGVLHWDVHFSQLVQDWELEPLSVLMDFLFSERKWGKKHCWKPAKGQGFEVGGYYHSLSMSHAMSSLEN